MIENTTDFSVNTPYLFPTYDFNQNVFLFTSRDIQDEKETNVNIIGNTRIAE